MLRAAGIRRDGARLAEGVRGAAILEADYLASADGPRDALAAIELENMALVASIVVRAAEFRTESRAAHYRDDYPDRDDAHWFANVYACQDADGQMALTKETICLTTPSPAAVSTEIVFPRAEYDRRQGAVHAEMAADGLDGVLVLGPENMFYLTGDQQTIGYSSFQAAVVPAGGEPRLLVRELERDAAVALSMFAGEPLSYNDDTDPPQALIGLLREMGLDRGRVGFDPSSPALPVRHYHALTSALPSLSLVPATPVEHARVIKSDLEIACLRQSARYCEAAVGAALAAVRQGATDNEVAAAASAAILAAGSEYLTIDPIVTTGHRSGIAHTTFHRQRIGPGDAVLLEMAGSHRRYPGALMRTAVIGPPSDLARRMYDRCATRDWTGRSR